MSTEPRRTDRFALDATRTVVVLDGLAPDLELVTARTVLLSDRGTREANEAAARALVALLDP